MDQKPITVSGHKPDTKQLNVAISAELYDSFRAVTLKNRLSYREVIERLIDVYTADASTNHTRHLDGSVCPLETLLQGLKDEVLRWKA